MEFVNGAPPDAPTPPRRIRLSWGAGAAPKCRECAGEGFVFPGDARVVAGEPCERCASTGEEPVEHAPRRVRTTLSR